MKVFDRYTANDIRPRGWLKRQLQLQAAGQAGNLDKMWPDVKDSAWIGGNADGWERAPYWLDGFIPLAFLLDDDDMKQRAKRYIDAILARQEESGWICPCKEEDRDKYDLWVVYLIAKVLVLYYEHTGDERIPDAVYRCLKNCYELLCEGKIHIFLWAKWRWFECFIALNFLRERYDDQWILDFAKLLKKEGTDYKAESYRWEHPLFNYDGETHVVNVSMQFKSEAVSHELLGEPYTDLAEELYQKAMQYNGMPIGTVTGDEHLAGLSPIQGTELCGIAELMYTFELLYAYTGESKWAERLELVAFNGLPATVSDDMWRHQYDQLSNQIECRRFPVHPPFSTNGCESHLFGLEPNWGCCTANFGQAWPKLTMSTFMKRGNTVVNVLPIPSELKTDTYHIVLDTDYPFNNRFQYTVSAAEDMTFKVRIPSFAKNLTVNGVAAFGDQEFAIAGGETVHIEIAYDTDPYFEARPHGLQTVKCGSLLFSVPIRYEKVMYEYEKNGVVRQYPYCDYELLRRSDWNYAYRRDALTVERRTVSDIPFSSENPPVVIHATAQKIDWGYEIGYDSVCAKTPRSTEPIGACEHLILYPYGCAKLRMTELPFVQSK